jgi:hypothetical protein
MNRAFDYNGTVVSQSKPVQKLRIVKKTVHLNSGDRDGTQYPTNGDLVLYLPKSYDNVVAVRVKGAEFPPISNFYVHNYSSTGVTFSIDTPLSTTGLYSIYLDIDNLNKSDESGPSLVVPTTTSPNCTACSGSVYCGPMRTCLRKTMQSYGGQNRRSTYVDNTFAKFQVDPASTAPILFSENSSLTNESYYQPPLSKLDRIHLHLRTHTQKSGVYKNAVGTVIGQPGYIYSSGGAAGTLEYGLSLELDILENSFDDFSSLETRISDRDKSFY